jgi:hypothetical protein
MSIERGKSPEKPLSRAALGAQAHVTIHELRKSLAQIPEAAAAREEEIQVGGDVADYIFTDEGGRYFVSDMDSHEGGTHVEKLYVTVSELGDTGDVHPTVGTRTTADFISRSKETGRFIGGKAMVVDELGTTYKGAEAFTQLPYVFPELVPTDSIKDQEAC